MSRPRRGPQGRFVVATDARGEAVGRFVYGRTYLANARAVDIDPVELKLSTRTYETARLRGIFGALRDAGPDRWGRRIIERHSGKPLLSELDYLLDVLIVALGAADRSPCLTLPQERPFGRTGRG